MTGSVRLGLEARTKWSSVAQSRGEWGSVGESPDLEIADRYAYGPGEPVDNRWLQHSDHELLGASKGAAGDYDIGLLAPLVGRRR
jgi:hypothetical protein